MPALKAGAFGACASLEAQAPPPGASATVNGSIDGVAAEFPLHGVRLVLAEYDPHVNGVVNAARDPSKNSSFISSNGSCGFSSNVAVN